MHMSVQICLRRPEESVRFPEIFLMWVLGIKPRSSGRAASALNCCATSPAPSVFKFLRNLHNDFRNTYTVLY